MSTFDDDATVDWSVLEDGRRIVAQAGRTMHLSFPRDGAPIACDCALGHSHDGDAVVYTDPTGGWCAPSFDALHGIEPMRVVRGGIRFPFSVPAGQPVVIPSPEPYPPVCDCGQRGGTNHRRNCSAYSGKYPEPSVTGRIHTTRVPPLQNIRPERSEPMSREDKAQELLALITRAEKQLANLDKIPDVDEYANGTVLRIVVRTRAGWNPITYILLKVVDEVSARERWYHTGRAQRPSVTKADAWFSDWPAVQAWLMSVHELVGIEELVPKSEVTAAQLDAAAAAAEAVNEVQSLNVKNLGISSDTAAFDPRDRPAF